MQEKPSIRIALLMLMGMVLSACTSVEVLRPPPTQPAPPPSPFAHRLATPEVEMYWNCTRPRLNVLRFDGMARNIGGREVRLLQLALKSMDANNLLQDAAALPEIVLYPNEFSPFHLRLPVRRRDARFDLVYQFRLAPRPDLPNPPPVEKRFTARGVCAETRYRAR